LLVNIFVTPSKNIEQKKFLLIRLDAIGDYVLFRNFIKVLKESDKYKDYSFTFVGNDNWKGLSEELDGQYIDEFIWVNKNKFTRNLVYRYKKLKSIALFGYEVILCPVYSRDFFDTDMLVKIINATEKIGSDGDLSNINRWQKKIGDKYYDKIIPANDSILFEFDRNKEFFENFLDVKLEIYRPNISLNCKKIQFNLPHKYAILFIGASSITKQWSIENFAKVGKHIKEKYGHDIVLCGAPNDREAALKFSLYFKDTYIDLVGKTSLIELLQVFSKGNLMVSNETVAPHMAVALNMASVIVIYSGRHYGRFAPYPKEMSPNYHLVYHPEIKENLIDYSKVSNSNSYKNSLDINEIKVDMVTQKIKEALIMNG
tara:strand:- start:5211 stop:6326 length:1116 start_codon:yes stop_codon:yes gene_type:complete